MPKTKTTSLPVLPIKNTVLFPYIHMPFSVGRPTSVAALESALATEEKEILVVCQRDSADQEPAKDDLCPAEVEARVREGDRKALAVGLRSHQQQGGAKVRASQVPGCPVDGAQLRIGRQDCVARGEATGLEFEGGVLA